MHVFDREGRRKSSGPALFARVHLRVRQQVFPSYSARPAMLPGKVSLVLEPFRTGKPSARDLPPSKTWKLSEPD